MGDCEPHENAVNDCKPPKNPPRDSDCPKVGNLDLSIQRLQKESDVLHGNS